MAEPLTAVAAAGAAVAGTALAGLGVEHALLPIAAGTAFSAVLGYHGGKAAAQPRADATYRRGALLLAAPPPKRRPAAARAHEITLGGLPVPASDRTKHFKLIGATGTGKSTAIQELLSSALRRVQAVKKRSRSDHIADSSEFDNQNVLVDAIVIRTAFAVNAVLLMGFAWYIAAEISAVGLQNHEF